MGCGSSGRRSIAVQEGIVGLGLDMRVHNLHAEKNHVRAVD
jgi:hypothetical protein